MGTPSPAPPPTGSPQQDAVCCLPGPSASKEFCEFHAQDLPRSTKQKFSKRATASDALGRLGSRLNAAGHDSHLTAILTYWSKLSVT